MKKLLLTLAIIALLGNSAFAFQNEPTGYDGRDWGSQRPSFWARQISTKNLDFKNDKIGGRGVLINFCYDNEVLVGIKFKNFAPYYQQTEIIKNMLLSKYGTGEGFIQEGNTYIWVGDKTIIKFVDSPNLDLSYTSTAFHKQVINGGV